MVSLQDSSDYSENDEDDSGPNLDWLPDPDKIYGPKDSGDEDDQEEDSDDSEREEEEAERFVFLLGFFNLDFVYLNVDLVNNVEISPRFCSPGVKRKWKPPKKKKEPKLKKRRMDSSEDEEELANLGDDEDFALKLLQSIR